jgi:hypothetical protein
VIEDLDEDGQDEAQTSASTLDDEALLRRFKVWFRQDKRHSTKWREAAAEDYDFFAGEQWSEQERSVLREQMRPIISFNRVAPVISAVSGTEITNRQEIRYIPREQGDAMPNEIASNAAKWFRDQCDAEDEESDAFLDTLIQGMGWTETRLDFEIEEEGAPIIDRVDPFEMYWDSASRKRNIVDSRRLWRVKRLPREEALALVPGIEEDDVDASWANVDDARNNSNETRQEQRFYRPTARDGAGPVDGTEDLVTFVEVQWWERETVHVVADPATNQTQMLSTEELETVNKRMKELGSPALKAATQTRRKYYRAYVGKSVLLKEESPFGNHFSWNCITGYRDRNTGLFYGLVKQMKDPQRWANKWLSQTLHILNTSAKGGAMVEKGAFADEREAEKNWAKAEKFVYVEKGALTGQGGPKILPKPNTAGLPPQYTQLMEFAVQSIRDVSGVNLELLGQKDAEQAGVLEAQRKKQAMAVLAAMFDSLRRYRKNQGRLLLFIIQNYLSDGRLIRVVGDNGAKYVPLIRDQSFSKYDVVVDDAPTSPQQKEMTWAILMQVMPLLKDQMSPQMQALLFEQSPLPESFIEKFKELVAQQMAQSAPAQQEAREIQKRGEIAKVEETQTKAALNAAKAEKEMAGTRQQHIQNSMPQVEPPSPFPMEAAE